MLRVPARRFALVLMVMQAAGLAVLAVAEDRAKSWWHRAVRRHHGQLADDAPAAAGRAVRHRDYGRIYSTSQLVTVIGVAGCPPLIGVLYETSGGYTVPFLAVAALTLVGLAILGLFGGARR